MRLQRGQKAGDKYPVTDWTKETKSLNLKFTVVRILTPNLRVVTCLPLSQLLDIVFVLHEA